MAQELGQADALAQQALVLSRRFRALYRDVNDFLANNTTQNINWATPPSYITTAEDAAGNMGGFLFTPAQVSNVIGTFQQFANLMNNQAATTGNHLGNVCLIASDAAV